MRQLDVRLNHVNNVGYTLAIMSCNSSGLVNGHFPVHSVHLDQIKPVVYEWRYVFYQPKPCCPVHAVTVRHHLDCVCCSIVTYVAAF
jgi:hypothetical protein